MADHDLHQDFGELKATVAANSTELRDMRGDMRDLRGEVKELTAALNQARGAKWAGFVMLGLVSAAFSVGASILTFFGLRFTMGGN